MLHVPLYDDDAVAVVAHLHVSGAVGGYGGRLGGNGGVGGIGGGEAAGGGGDGDGGGMLAEMVATNCRSSAKRIGKWIGE